MKPTLKLRFVERGEPLYPDSDTARTVRILQQWWETIPMGTVNLGWTGDIPLGEVRGEWRDVPIEKDQA